MVSSGLGDRLGQPELVEGFAYNPHVPVRGVLAQGLSKRWIRSWVKPQTIPTDRIVGPLPRSDSVIGKMEMLTEDANRDLDTLLGKLDGPGKVPDWQVQALLSRVHYSWCRAADLWLQHLTGKDLGRSTRGGPPRTKWRLLATPARYDSDGHGGVADHSLRQAASRIDLVK